MTLKEQLDLEVAYRNKECELSLDKPDPLLVARTCEDEFSMLLCALFAYGNAKLIVQFLQSLDFSLLNESEERIQKELQGKYYRFQNEADIQNIFIALRRLKQEQSLETIFYKAYSKEQSVLEGIDALIAAIRSVSEYESQGYNFLLSKAMKRDKFHQIKTVGNAPYKRWNMFLRWMVRKDCLDLGFWTKVESKDLILPLDTHTFHVSRHLGLLERKTYDLHSAVLVTEKLKEFDAQDPVKYDFALYRIGQEKIY
ncbi:TIGR02757 family protein [Candidatus Marinarcus aquaticus]|uniref:TIGR02757 family protein n=1 Tax=Candidatus Marinarcus aquaticus TaxID=2044504 RepID=A0A4Q0XRN9_9BACT|nr:TIGR02757 family protein [Candidatus Marinarcus aquaticus]RXJ60006.1 TIGR02757 family protein [Candidatus Marinarcus aquaticus]